MGHIWGEAHTTDGAESQAIKSNSKDRHTTTHFFRRLHHCQRCNASSTSVKTIATPCGCLTCDIEAIVMFHITRRGIAIRRNTHTMLRRLRESCGTNQLAKAQRNAHHTYDQYLICGGGSATSNAGSSSQSHRYEQKSRPHSTASA